MNEETPVSKRFFLDSYRQAEKHMDDLTSAFDVLEIRLIRECNPDASYEWQMDVVFLVDGVAHQRKEE